jgi:hypothetical protein
VKEFLRPNIKWPDSFKLGISTNEYGLNLTEIIYYDKKNKKMRTQLFYSIMGLEPTKGMDIVLDEKNGIVVIQTNNDCAKAEFTSLLSVNLFFSMFNSLTDYEGKDENGLKAFKVKQFTENTKAPKFYFLFNDNNVFSKSRIVSDLGQYDFESIIPLEETQFLEEDWYNKEECRDIEEHILDDSSNFASFMYQLVLQLIGSEEEMI